MKHNSRPSTILSAMPRLEITHVWTLKYLLFLEKEKTAIIQSVNSLRKIQSDKRVGLACKMNEERKTNMSYVVNSIGLFNAWLIYSNIIFIKKIYNTHSKCNYSEANTANKIYQLC